MKIVFWIYVCIGSDTGKFRGVMPKIDKKTLAKWNHFSLKKKGSHFRPNSYKNEKIEKFMTEYWEKGGRRNPPFHNI